MLTSDLKSVRLQDSETGKRLCSGNRLAVGWEIGNTEGDVDLGGLGDDAKTIDTIRRMSYKDAQGGDPKELVTKVTSYALTDTNCGRYIGIEVTPTTQTGTPDVGAALHLYDVSTASGGGSNSDNVAPGSVTNQNLKIAIFVNGTNIDFVNDNTPIELDKAYVTRLYSGENKNGKLNAGTDTDAAASYDFRWVLSGSNQQLGTSGGVINSGFNNDNLIIPMANGEARTDLNGPTRDGKKALSIPTNGDGIQSYRLHIICRHK